MKKLFLLSVTILSLAACQKLETVLPEAKKPVTPNPISIAAKPDTIPDKSAFKIDMAKDSFNYDEAIVMFNHTANPAYAADEDAAYLAGYGQESLAAISSDGKDLAINVLPYTSGMSVGLNVNAKSSGSFLLKINYMRNIPANIQVWVKDSFTKDSVNVRTKNYSFSVNKDDANSFGDKRFKLVIRDKGSN